MTYNKRQRRQRIKNIWGIVIILLVITLIVLSIGGGWYLQQYLITLNNETLCPIDGPHALTVILIDQTDSLNIIQQQAIRVRLKEIQMQTPRYGGIMLFLIGDTNRDLLRPIEYICNPGAVTDASPLYQNIHIIEQRWQIFAKRLEQIFNNFIQITAKTHSPIIENIQSIALTNFVTTKLNIPKRLILVSDLLQHSQELSFYQRIPNFSHINSELFHKLHSPLTGVEIEILYLRRSTKQAIQSKDLIKFWQQYLESNGGSLTRVVSIEG